MEKIRQEADAADETDEEDPDAQHDYKAFKAWLDQSVAEGGNTVKLVGGKVVDKPVATPNPPSAAPQQSASSNCALCKKPTSECPLFDQLTIYYWMI